MLPIIKDTFGPYLNCNIMQNTFSRTFLLDGTVPKKFYFTPHTAGKELTYHVHINMDPELKKFRMDKGAEGWKITAQAVRLPEWLSRLESQFNVSIEEVLASQVTA